MSGTDAEDFTLSSGGALAFNEVPDFEEPADSNRDNRFQVTIEAREQGDGTSVGRLNVAIRVTDVDERGMIETNVEEPRVGQPVRLNVVDADGGERVTKWKWERGEPNSPCGTVTTWETITRARSNSYTPTVDDQGHCIRVTAFYNDRSGTGRTEQFLTPNSVEIGPFFTQDQPTFRVEENTAEDRNIGRVQAQHSNRSEALTYRLSGDDASYFTIDNNGQLKTSPTALDYETQPGPVAEFQVVATDSNSETATITVTVNVTDECTSTDEPPCAPGRPSVSSASDTSLQVSWSAPRTPSGTDITGYDLQYRELDSGDSWIPETTPGTDSSHTIENLTKNTTYEVQVRGSNADGEGAWSVSGTGTPGGVSPPHLHLHVEAAEGAGVAPTARLRWMAPRTSSTQSMALNSWPPTKPRTPRAPRSPGRLKIPTQNTSASLRMVSSASSSHPTMRTPWTSASTTPMKFASSPWTAVPLARREDCRSESRSRT